MYLCMVVGHWYFFEQQVSCLGNLKGNFCQLHNCQQKLVPRILTEILEWTQEIDGKFQSTKSSFFLLFFTLNYFFLPRHITMSKRKNEDKIINKKKVIYI